MKHLRYKYVRRGSAESADHQIMLGQQLAVEKQACRAAGLIWKNYVKETFDLSRERADELIRIGLGVNSVEEYRLRRKLERRLHRQKYNLNEAAKAKFMRQVHASIIASQKALSSATKSSFSKEEVAEMREAISSSIFAWQDLFDVLR